MGSFYYLGRKESIASEIVSVIEGVSGGGGRACDLFAGSGSIAASLSAMRPVTAVDIQEYSRVLCSALLSHESFSFEEIEDWVKSLRGSSLLESMRERFSPLLEIEAQAIARAVQGDPLLLADLVECPPLVVGGVVMNSEINSARLKVSRALKMSSRGMCRASTIARYYGGVYFSYSQAIAIDVMLESISARTFAERDVFTAATLSVASQVVNTVGKQFAQPVRPRGKDGEIKNSFVKSAIRDRLLDPIDLYGVALKKYSTGNQSTFKHEAICGDFLDILKRKGEEFSVVYADPPYTRDHYSRFYHVLETMCLRDEPALSQIQRKGVKGTSRGIYREGRHQSPFCVRSEATAAFENLFEAARYYGLPLVLSYSPSEEGDGTHPRVLSASVVTDTAKKYYRSVDVSFIEGKRHNFHNRAEVALAARDSAEMLIVCQV